MRKSALVIPALLAIVTSTCGPGPKELAEQFVDAINSKKTAAALELLSDAATLQVDGTPTRTGTTQIEDWLTTQAKLNIRIEGNLTASGSGATVEGCRISSDQWIYFGINPMSGICDLVLEGGHITSFAIQFDADSMARLSESAAAVNTDLPGIWTAVGVTPDDPHRTIPGYLQFFEDGIGRWGISPEDLSLAPDSDHPGVRLTWKHEDYVLTIQNQGPAAEGYCQGQDVGKYLVRKTDTGTIQFKALADPCGWRMFQLTLGGGD